MAVRFDPQAVRARAQRAVLRGIVRGTEAVRNEAISLILNGQKTGRMYSHRGVVHQASAPGEAPASDTGDLVAGIVTRYDLNNMTGHVVSTSAHGPYLEYGTQRIEPRPYMRPALANKQGDIAKYIHDEITKEFAK